MPPLNSPGQPGKAFWRSLEDRADTPEFRRFVEREFPSYADEMLEPTSRRNFLKLMGASMALAGMTSCRWPSEEILPFTQRPEGWVPGDPQQFATAMELDGVARPLLVKSYDGRPIKIEGNPLHPACQGTSSALAQASVLELYDPARARDVVRRDGDTVSRHDWEWFADFAGRQFGELRATGGRGLRVLAQASSSPSELGLRRHLFEAFPAARWYEYEPVSRDNERDGSSLAFGSPHRAHLALDRAELIVSFDDDFLVQHPDALRNARNFATRRDPERSHESGLVVFESGYSNTGTVADRRYALAPGLIPAAAACLAAKLFLEQRLPGVTPELADVLDRFATHPLNDEIDWDFVESLVAQRGHGLVVAGPRQPAEVHALVQLINAALGNVGQTVTYTADPDPRRPHHMTAIRELAAEIESGEVDTLLVLGGNPAYDAPADLDLATLLGRVATTIHLGLFENETSRACRIHLPQAHYLESWGDARDYRGIVTLRQPLIEPLYGGKSVAELLALILDDSRSGHDLVRASVEANRPERAERVEGLDREAWRQSLHDGFIEDTEWPESVPEPVSSAAWATRLEPHAEARAPQPADGLELVFKLAAGVHDGRYANSGWLQELPDPLTKLTWDNAALIGPATAEALGLSHGEMVRLEHDGRGVDLPVFIMPGQAAGSASVALGYGRRHNGPAEHAVAVGVGFDVYPLRTSTSPDRAVVSASRVESAYTLATTQDHWAIDALGSTEREKRTAILVREIDRAEYLHDPEAAMGHGHGAHEVELWQNPAQFEGHRWGMAIDLNACTGCNACVVACQSENNIPVVGKDEVQRGREMHWIRIDRYFSGDPEQAEVSFQPVTCQHCENAPCEQVCPVAATTHDHEGINVMVYNRCVGTRYCANNCPYKVRRFNWFNNHKHETAIETMVYNPEVSVRSRGVMEKCTYCIQRINGAKIRAKSEGRELRDGEITTACEQACPSRAITFGDLNDPHSRVAKKHHDHRAYAMLEEWNIKPSNRYLARLRSGAKSGHKTETHG